MQQSEWTKIYVFIYPQDAYLAKAYLESEGITVFLKDEVTTQVFNFGSQAFGGVKMLVPTELAQQAIELLKSGGYVSEESLEEAMEVFVLKKGDSPEHCPYCNSTNIALEKKPNLITILLYFVGGAIFPITSKMYLCFDCEKRWKWKKG